MIIWIGLALMGVLLFYHAFKFPKIPDNYLVFLLGKKRSGKSTFLAWCAIHYYLRFRPVYSTSPLPCAKLINYEDIGVVQFPKHSVILIDEVGMIWDNRNFKNFQTHVRDYFKLQGHYKHTVIMASQSYDVDLKIRSLADMLGVVENFGLFNLSRIRWISRRITLTEAQGDQPSSISESLKFRFPLFGGNSFIYRPLWYPFFDSYEAPELAAKKFSIPCGMKHKFKRKKYLPVIAFAAYRITLTGLYKKLSKPKNSAKPSDLPSEQRTAEQPPEIPLQLPIASASGTEVLNGLLKRS